MTKPMWIKPMSDKRWYEILHGLGKSPRKGELQHEIRRLREENERLREVVDAAREVAKHGRAEDYLDHQLWQALRELEEEENADLSRKCL
jgi:hypothetical protein